MSKKPSINCRFRTYWNENNPSIQCWVVPDTPEEEFQPFREYWLESGTDMKIQEWLRMNNLNNYKLDFVLMDYALCVEIDGQEHGRPANIQKDRKKANDLQIHLGYTILRYPAQTVVASMSYVEDEIRLCLKNNFGVN